MAGRAPFALVGPTASGKTEASLPVAEALHAEIVCVDSMLVYRGMDVGTAKPTPEERARVPHHLIDLADPTEPFSVARFQRAARRALDAIRSRGAAALLVGGSGLYHRAVVDELRFPGTSPSIRRRLEAEVDRMGPEALHRRLASSDPEAAAKIEPGNARRVVRALEVAAVTGRPFSSFADDWHRYPPGAVVAAGIEVPRAVLHRRIDRRVASMMPGLLSETAALAEREHGFAGFLTATQAIGYAEAFAVLEGRVSEEEAVRRTASRTRALARRQMAWFRGDPRIRWFATGEGGAAERADDLVAFFRTAGPDRAEEAAGLADRVG